MKRGRSLCIELVTFAFTLVAVYPTTVESAPCPAPIIALDPVEEGQSQVQQNSTRKKRVKPSKLAAKAGTSVNWAPSVEAAVKRSQSSGKMIFWYVPTIHGTFMDRKPVVDRYMMAGYFSWPKIIAELNEHFIAVKSAPTRQQQKQFELSRYKFIEPGFLILTPDGNERARVDRITTQHPDWLLRYLSLYTDQGVAPSAGHDSTEIQSNNNEKNDDPVAAEFFASVQLFHTGDHAVARKAWLELAQGHPDHPLAWKAAAEAQGIGPFARGFEVFGDLPERAFRAGIESLGSGAPPNTFTQQELWQRGVDFLLRMQRKDGGFYDSDYDFGGADSLPNVYVAVTALAGMALLDGREMVHPDKVKDVNNAIARCVSIVTNEQNINRVDRDEILWADSYRLRFIARCHVENSNQELDKKLQSTVRRLENLQSRRGTWYHEYENPFVTATALIALYEARSAGAIVDAKKTNAGVQALKKLRGNDGSFPYGARPSKGGKVATAASAGRMPLCELALHDWGQSDQVRLKYAIEQSFEYHHFLDAALKYDNHTSNHGYGGFFFWYDMRSRTEAIAAIQDKSLRRTMMKKQLAIVLSLPELDGCFVDSHELGRCYGTAMALLCLKRIQNELKD